MLHLLRAVLDHLGQSLSNVSVIYFKRQDEFEELEHFMRTIGQKYGFSLTTIEDDFKHGLVEFLAENPKIEIIFMGQRKMDPHGGSLQEISPSDTDKGWPLFQRINPILLWTYREIWEFLREFKLEYCTLYDRGYTSLGAKRKTSKNEALWDGTRYLPAYLLDDDTQERSGRSTPAQSPSRDKVKDP